MLKRVRVRVLNVRRREALQPELHASYRYLCAPSNPISSELFRDDLPKAVKDITDTNRITSKLQRDKKESYARGRQHDRPDKSQRKRNYSGAKSYLRPSQYKEEGRRKVQNPKSTQHPNLEVVLHKMSVSKWLIGSNICCLNGINNNRT